MFLKATLLGEIKDEDKIIQSGSSITKDGTNKIISIHIYGQLEDDAIAEKKNFDFLIEGDTLDAIRGNIRAGVAVLFRQKAKLNYNDWMKDVVAKQRIITAITDDDVSTQFGIKEVTSLD